MNQKLAGACGGIWVLSLTIALSALCGHIACAGGPSSTAAWLVDLARDHGLNCRGRQTPADVRQIRVLLEAAGRLDPTLPDTWVWLQELSSLSDDGPATLRALEQLVRTDPTHQTAFFRWLTLRGDSWQTAEQRCLWLEELVADAVRRTELRCMIHTQLARLALARLDRVSARQHLQQAFALDRWNADAGALEVELVQDEPPLVRLPAMLRLLQFNPLDVELSWQVGVLLDQTGCPEQAETFYAHAQDVFSRAHPSSALPAGYRLQLAWHQVALGRLEEATQLVQEAVIADRALASEAGLLHYWLLNKRDAPMEAERIRQALSRRFAQVREPEEAPVHELAYAAWFCCTVDPQPQRAAMLAEAAARRAPTDRFVRRVLGWAQVLNLDTDAGIQTLTPIAGEDPYAAYRLARLALDAGDADTARRVVRDLSTFPIGPARDLLDQLGLDDSEPRWRSQRSAALAALSGFDQRVLEFHRNPSGFLEAAVVPMSRALRPGEPWWLEFRLTNRAPFAITLGPDRMVNPVFLLSFEVEGERRRSFPHLLTVAVDRVLVLPPGETVRTRCTVDLGPLRRAARQAPQHLQRVAVTAILDPMQDSAGQWQPALGGQQLRPVYFNRLPANASREALRALFAAFTGGGDAERFLAVEQMAELLGEAQRATLGRLNYRPEPIPEDRIVDALLAGLQVESWELRARTLEALQVVGLDQRMLAAIERCLRDEHWLVRLLAARLIGQRMGPAAVPLLRPLAEADPDELVRELAGCFVGPEDQAPASQP